MMVEPILVVGAGPTGLMAAFELARRGVPVEVIDAGTGPTPEHESRALALHARSLDLFKRNGLEDEVLAAGNKVLGVDLQIAGKALTQFDFAAAGTDRPFILVIPQGTTERILINALHQHGVEIQWQTQCVSLKNPEEPRVTAQTSFKETRQLTPKYVLVADGARSIVRQSIGASFDGETAPETFGLVDVQLTEEVDPTRFVANRLPSGILARIPINDRIVRYISNRPDIGETLPIDPGVKEVIWRSTFQISYRHVDTFQNGRVFLLGDAAHLHSPAGGRGMNLGLEDAAWFAHAHEKGLLDGFTAARLPYAKATLAISKRMMNGATSNSPIGNAAFRYLLPLAMRFELVRRNFGRFILAEEQPRPPFDG